MRVGQLFPFSGIPGRLQPWNSYALPGLYGGCNGTHFCTEQQTAPEWRRSPQFKSLFVPLALLPPPPRAPDTMVTTLLPWWGGWVVPRSHWDNGLGQQMVIILHYTLGTRAYWLDWCNPTQRFGAFLGLPSSLFMVCRSKVLLSWPSGSGVGFSKNMVQLFSPKAKLIQAHPV